MQVDMMVPYGATLLRDNAMVWWRSHVEAADQGHVPRIVNWVDFYNAISYEFQPINTRKIARDRLAELRQRNSVQQYAHEFRTITADIPGISEDEKIDRFVRGLKDRTRQEVDIRDPKTLDEAVRIADRYDTISYQAQRKSLAKGAATRLEPVPMELDTMAVQQRRNPEGESKRGNVNARGACFLCGKVGHLKRQCSLYRKQAVKANSQ